MNVTVITSDATVKVNTSQRVIEMAPSGWDEQIAEYGRGANLPQPTGDTFVKVGADKDIEDTVFAPMRVANSLKVPNSLVNGNPLILGNTNAFGNLNRYNDLLGGQDFSGNGDLLIDTFTHIMWYLVYMSADTWDNQLSSALASTQGGYNNWFIPSDAQIATLKNFNGFRVAPFDTSFKDQWTSTTRNNNNLHAIKYTNTEGTYLFTAKTNTVTAMMCRLHTFE